ncbi:hypothetical protein [Pseudonocardia zijingensis]|uniref:Asp23/Gls24 family envelope stress response protein n=1 Tax=Pseudonocardia zijingensis TaxID=153376 RepID=A0ABN1N767_9PSEU
MPGPPDPVELAVRVADAVTAHPAVAGLHGGPYGSVATYLPGRRLLGVRIGEGDEPVEVAVVLRPDRPIPEVVRELRRDVSRLCGGAAVDITVADIAIPDPAGPGEAP